MANLNMYFAVDPGASIDAVIANVEAGLDDFDHVAHVQATADSTRFTGLEILAAISLVSQIVHHGSEIVHDVNQMATDGKSIIDVVRAFFVHVTDLVKKTPGIHEARVDVGLKSVPVTQLSDADIARIADAVAAKMATAK